MRHEDGVATVLGQLAISGVGNLHVGQNFARVQRVGADGNGIVHGQSAVNPATRIICAQLSALYLIDAAYSLGIRRCFVGQTTRRPGT